MQVVTFCDADQTQDGQGCKKHRRSPPQVIPEFQKVDFHRQNMFLKILFAGSALPNISIALAFSNSERLK